MCGVTGSWSSQDYNQAEIVRRMADKISSRGPDDFGVWASEDKGLALAHRRLSIVDLSPAGHQPMVSSCGRFVLVYNGEIYNHLDIRQLLFLEEGVSEWVGRSDTETLLVAISKWGLRNTLIKLNGMYAFALWDDQSKELYLARDRVGEKPMYYGTVNNIFLFGSQLKALTAHPSWSGDIDHNALSLFMKYGYVPAPKSIYENILKLPPAHFVVISDNANHIATPTCYWDINEAAQDAITEEYTSSESVADNLELLLLDSVKRRMVADVPLGAFLSGGIDSTTIVAMMQSAVNKPIKTFSIGFNEEDHDEAKHAKQIAEHLGTDHTELYIGPQDLLAVLPRLSAIYDEPFADPSQIPTFIVSELAKNHVTVSLSGDGGDELFFGYTRYFQAQSWWRKLRLVPWPIRHFTASIIMAMASIFIRASFLLPSRLTTKHIGDRIPKFARVIDSRNWITFYDRIISQGNYPEPLVLRGTSLDSFMKRYEPGLVGLSDAKKMMYLDIMMYLPDVILTKVDRASMAVSLEARVPFLDHRIIEFAWNIPFRYKYRKGKGKWILREVLNRYVPRELMDRPKMGFSVPIEDWLRGPLKDWADNLLEEQKLHEQGFFDASLVRKMWEEHKSGKRRWHAQIWRILVFQMWLSENL